MSLFDNLGKKIGDAAQSAVKKSGELVEVTKLNLSISAEEGKIKELYEKIGEYIYNQYAEGKEMIPEVNEFCSQIKACKENISQLKSKIYELKGVKVCPKCGAESEKQAAFCSSCGEKLQ